MFVRIDRPHLAIAIAVTLSAALVCGVRAQDDATDDVPHDQPPRLSASTHAPLPGHASEYWFVPDAPVSRTSATRRAESNSPLARFAGGVQLIAKGEFAPALPLVN